MKVLKSLFRIVLYVLCLCSIGTVVGFITGIMGGVILSAILARL